jgi:methionine-R-sulfoxide reductase
MKHTAAALVLSAATLLTMSAAEPYLVPNEVVVSLLGSDGQPLPPAKVPAVKKSDAEWLAQLGPERFRILRSQGTERPFCGTLLDNKKTGVYLCAGCDLPLFASSAKFNSGTGWPSFFQPFAKENVTELTDRSHGMVRTEILCTRCGGHLGHVFPDGPKPTGLRYCLNSEAMVFQEIK